MPIVANVPIKKLAETVIVIIDFFDKQDNSRVENIDVSGYLFYKYRGTLFVRRGVSNTFMRNEKGILKNYIEYIINYLANENRMAWTRTVIALEISIAIKRNADENFVIVIEVSNEKIDEWGNLIIRPFIISEDKERKRFHRDIDLNDSEIGDPLSEIDNIIIEEDLRKITSIDLFSILTPKDLNDLLNELRKMGVMALVKEENE